jgi:hypothetical protein
MDDIDQFIIVASRNVPVGIIMSVFMSLRNVLQMIRPIHRRLSLAADMFVTAYMMVYYSMVRFKTTY